MQRYAWLLAPIIIVLYCCNSTKKVLNDPEKTQKVVDAYLLKSPLKIDTIYKPGDTTTTLLISYDTSYVMIPAPTGNNVAAPCIPTQVTKTVTKTMHVHDTVIIHDNRLLQTCQDNLRKFDISLKSQEIETAKQARRGSAWELKFWALFILAAICIAFSIKFL